MCCDATVAEPSSMESPWEAILHTNTAPSDSDCRRIQDFLNAPRRAVADLTEEIMRMQNLLDGLTRKRDELSQLIDSHLALVSPARRLPEDVISAIFIACVSSTSNATLDSETAPLLLCQICSAWRRVALSTPQLWTSLHISLLSTLKTQDLADIASCWLSRSGVLPLSISLIYTDVHEQSDEPDLSPLASLAKFSLRWKSINMVLPTFRSFESISHLSSDAFPILQTASVGSIKKDPIPSSPWEFLTLLTASSLRRVSISSAYKLPALQLPWAYLTNLEIDTAYEYTPPGPAEEPALTEYDILSMLRPCLALQTCDLDIDITDALDQIHEPVPVSLLHLRHLGVSLKRHCSPGRLFSKLVLPNLRSLNLSSAPDNRPLPSCVFFPSLEHLSLGIRLQDSTGLFRNLKLVPRLTELEIHGELVLPRAEEWARFEPDADFLARFAPDGEPAICPNLSRLRLYFFKALSDDVLLAFIQSRTGPARGAVAHLTHVTARLPRKMQRDILEPLQPLIADGLQISLVWD